MFDWFQTLRNDFQQHGTTYNRVCKQMHTVKSKNVGSCWPTMLHAFAWGFKGIKSNKNDDSYYVGVWYDKIMTMNKGIAVSYSRGMTFSTPRDP